ncbi:MAG: 7TM domain-containing protein [Patescibacteria group bacterium]|nr:7TM domain-containing protein [Patescibacteria group bacterium]
MVKAIFILITLIEKFISTQVKKGFRTATFFLAETLVISVVGYYFIVWDIFRGAVLNYSKYILLLFAINIFLGKWTGLRLSEYLRFREVMKDAD